MIGVIALVVGLWNALPRWGEADVIPDRVVPALGLVLAVLALLLVMSTAVPPSLVDV